LYSKDETHFLFEFQELKNILMNCEENKFVEVYTLRDGVFVRQGGYNADETFDSSVLGKPVPLAGIFSVLDQDQDNEE